MTPETEGKEEKGSSGLPFINDPGNEDPGSLMDDATVPLNDSAAALRKCRKAAGGGKSGLHGSTVPDNVRRG